MIPLLPLPDFVASALSGAGSPPAFVAMIVVKATVVLAIGAVAAVLARHAGAAVRHAIVALTLAAALGLPLGMVAAPAWRVGILPPFTARQDGPGKPAPDSRVSSATVSPPASTATTSELTRSSTITISSSSPAVIALSSTTLSRVADFWIPIAWLVGLLSVLGWMIVGRIGLRRVAGTATALETTDWRMLMDEERERAGVDGPVAVLSSTHVSTPLAWGTRSPIILLPAESSEWPREHRAVVLRHELAHIARADALTQMLAGVTCAVYWFHPLVWVAARKLRAEQERACDERVLSSGTPPAEYAAHLLEVARSARALGAHGLVSLAMARPSQLEGRLLAVLNPSSRRHRISPAARIAGITGAFLVFVALSAFTPMPRASALPRAVTPTIIAAQFVPPQSPLSPEVKAASSWTRTGATRVAMDSSFERSVDVRAGETLVIDLRTGAGLTITAWDQNRVRVRGRLGGRNWRDTEVDLERTSSGARLSSRYTMRSSSQSSSHHFEIRVPKRFNVRVSSAGGGISITGVRGEFTGSTGGGSIRISDASGRAGLSTGGGSIRVNDSNLSGSVGTGGGSVLIQRVRGGLRGSSGSGPIVYGNAEDADIVSAGGSSRISDDKGGVTVGAGGNVTINERTGEIRDNSTGRIIYRKAGGRISIAEAMNGADVRTEGGSVSIGRSAGDVRALTGGGDITIGPLDGSASATTGAGDVTITLRGGGHHSVDVASGNGKVTLVLPSSFSGRVELETAYTERHGRTRIESDWPLSVTETDFWDDSHGTPRKFVRARQAIGRGGAGLLRVKTVNGNIILRRGD
ncbi:MAG TPA: M56 family metallopeptidase [Gemmatimonadaceae bacterium]|nr:M56 family metallopeptidase [Gemmatimonadaceae bacterium]